MKFKWYSFTMMILMVFVLAACSDNDDSGSEKEADKKTEETNKQSEEAKDKDNSSNEASIGEELEFEEFSLTVNKVYLSEDLEGKDMLVVDYSWTNKTKDEKAPVFTAIVRGFQDDIDTSIHSLREPERVPVEASRVRPNGVVENIERFLAIADMNKPMELEIGEVLDLKKERVRIIKVDLSSLK